MFSLPFSSLKLLIDNVWTVKYVISEISTKMVLKNTLSKTFNPKSNFTKKFEEDSEDVE
jgi:hypothetical protein